MDYCHFCHYCLVLFIPNIVVTLSMSTPHKNIKEDVLTIMKLMAENLKVKVAADKRTYNDQRTLICQLFNTTSGEAYNVGSVMLRLTVIDSLYATNAAYSYFSIEEMAQRIIGLGNETETCQRFANYALQKEDAEVKALFDEPFGIRKNLADGSKQVSLLSKYAYYCLLQQGGKYHMGFPIYDSLAKDIYPKLWKKLLPEETMNGSDNMADYVKDLSKICNSLFEEGNTIFGMQQFDLLDAYLWRMGKFSNGNLSLLLERNDYIEFIKNLELQVDTTLSNNGKTEFELLPQYAERMGNKYNGKPLIGKKCINISPNANTVNVDELVLCEFLEGTKNPFAGLKEEKTLMAMFKHWKENYGCKTSSANISKDKTLLKSTPIVNTTLTIGSFTEAFKKQFGAVLRIYNGRSKADDGMLLQEVGLTQEINTTFDGKQTVGALIEQMAKAGLKVKVYTCDEWVAVLDGLTLEQAGKIKKNATKADMESIIACKRQDKNLQGYTIEVREDGGYTVKKDGVECDNTKTAMREIAGLIGLKYDASWTTRQFGSKLIGFLNNK